MSIGAPRSANHVDGDVDELVNDLKTSSIDLLQRITAVMSLPQSRRVQSIPWYKLQIRSMHDVYNGINHKVSSTVAEEVCEGFCKIYQAIYDLEQTL